MVQWVPGPQGPWVPCFYHPDGFVSLDKALNVPPPFQSQVWHCSMPYPEKIKHLLRGPWDGEIKQLKEVFITNGYPWRKVTELMNKRPRMKVKTEEELEGKEKLLLVLPYILYTGPE